jgi:hypothetical protein
MRVVALRPPGVLTDAVALAIGHETTPALTASDGSRTQATGNRQEQGTTPAMRGERRRSPFRADAVADPTAPSAAGHPAGVLGAGSLVPGQRQVAENGH